MTKKQIHQEINRRFYEHVNEKYPQLDIDDSEGYGRIYLVFKDKKLNGYDSIEYHQSRHDINYAFCEDKTIQIANELELFLNELLKQYNI